jgi:ribosome-binding factor A
MSVDRTLRLNEMMRRAIAEALPRVIHEAELDLAAVTVTHVVVSGDLHTARVFVSILGHEQDRKRMMNVLQRHRPELQEIVSRQVVIKYTPRMLFQLDESLEKGDHILHILDQLPPPGDADAAKSEENADETAGNP